MNVSWHYLAKENVIFDRDIKYVTTVMFITISPKHNHKHNPNLNP